MNKIFLILLVLTAINTAAIQKVTGQVTATGPAPVINKQHKIVFQLSIDDSLAHKALMKQLNNITTVAPGTKIEVVCHGPGLNMLVIGKTVVHEKIIQLIKKDIAFVSCEFSMSERNVPKEKIIPEAGFVKAGIVEIVTRQEQGWSYIKSGF